MSIRLTQLEERANTFDKMRGITGSQNQVLLVNKNGGITPTFPMQKIRLVDNTTDLEVAKGEGANFQEIFDTWERVSFRATSSLASAITEKHIDPTEEQAWVYDAPTGRVYCPINSSNALAFLSPDKIENYSFEAVLNTWDNGTLDGDNDYTGLVLGWVEEDGVYWPLIYARRSGYTTTTGTSEGNHALHLGFAWDNSPVDILAHGAADSQGATLRWSDKLGGCRVKVVREGSILTFYTTLLYDTSAETMAADFEVSSTFSYDLNSNPLTKRFLGPQRYGYFSFSQMNSNFDVISSPTTFEPILDTENNTVWTYDESSKSYIESPYDEAVTKGLFYHDQTASKLYYCNPMGDLVEMK